jgi:hypothetical protein
MKSMPLYGGLFAIGLAGCALSPEQQERNSFLRMQADNPVVCHNVFECNVKWDRSEQWLRDNAYWAIRTIDETRIETKKPPHPHYYNRNWYKVSKLARNDGSTIISLYASCLPAIICVPELDLATGAFNHFVNTGKRFDLVTD